MAEWDIAQERRVLDRIYIRRLHARCIIGIYPEEREKKQDVYIDITLYGDLRTACETDRIDDTVNYKDVKNAVHTMVEGSNFQLIEHLAEQIARICLGPRQISRCEVVIDKPGALRFAESVAVHIVRERP